MSVIIPVFIALLIARNFSQSVDGVGRTREVSASRSKSRQ